VTGFTGSEDFPTTAGAFMTTLQADRELPPWVYEETSAFVTKFDHSELKVLPPTTTVVTSSANPQIAGTDVILTARVTPQAGVATPTGLVGFDFNNYLWFSAPVDSTGTATFTIPNAVLPLGTNNGVATYLGDSNNAPSDGAFTQTIVYYPTTLAITASPTSANSGSPITFTMTVTGMPASPVPAGTVQLSDFAYPPFGTLTAPVDSNGVATITTSALPAVVNTIFVKYFPNDDLHASSTATLYATVIPTVAPASPVFSPPPGTYSSPQNVTLTDSTPAAEICYTSDGTTPSNLCQVIVQSTSQYLHPIPVTQTTTIEAIAISENVLQSSVVTGVYTITSLATVTAVPSAPNITTDQSLSVAITVSGPSGDPVPTGYLTLTSGTYTAPQAMLSGGSTTINIPAGNLPVGIDVLTADYIPDNISSPTYNGVTGSTSVVVTNPPPPPIPTLTLSGTAVTLKAGATTGNTSTITLTPSGGFGGIVTLTAVIATGPAGAAQPTLSFGSTIPLDITSSSPGTATLTITTAASQTEPCTDSNHNQRGATWYALGGGALSCIVLLVIPTRRRRLRMLLGMLGLLVGLSGGLVACGSATTAAISNCNPYVIPGTPTGAYTITVSSGSLASTAVTLNVQ
jgi:hypothetical protein